LRQPPQREATYRARRSVHHRVTIARGDREFLRSGRPGRCRARSSCASP
jgi:hypothetical protein